ncbi:MAG: DUF368 domain-containing protein [Verrucomicrobia bacterium]|nr:DUF368 domain-containing protein [Verrucomicrobiota bacterium]
MAGWFRVFFSGMCVGAADIVPGISGGTVAFIIGVYEQLLKSIATINMHSLQHLFSLRIRAFFRVVAWRFLLAFVLGVGCSFLTLAKGFSVLLNHEVYRCYLYSAFMGLVIGSVVFCARLLSRFQMKTVFFFLCGAAAAYMLSGVDAGSVVQRGATSYIDIKLVLCGMLAISAMLLPGISGSFILTILGVYGSILGALIDFVEGVQAGVFEAAAFRIVLSVAIGIGVGAISFARVVSFCLERYRDATIACLVGFMVGAMKAVWPFWSYAYDGSRLKVVDPVLPDFGSWQFVIASLFAVGGVACVFLMEYLATDKRQQTT